MFCTKLVLPVCDIKCLIIFRYREASANECVAARLNLDDSDNDSVISASTVASRANGKQVKLIVLSSYVLENKKKLPKIFFYIYNVFKLFKLN